MLGVGGVDLFCWRGNQKQGKEIKGHQKQGKSREIKRSQQGKSRGVKVSQGDQCEPRKNEMK